jgi:DNA topoisomerase-1
VYALATLRRLVCESATEARRHIVATVKEVAGLLRNTPAVCRRCYIHPAVISAFEADELQTLPPGQSRRGLKVDEVAFAALLAHAEKRAAKLARQAGAKGRKLREAQAADSINGSISTLLQKSRVIRKEANKAAAKAGAKTGRAARAKVNEEVTGKASRKTGARSTRRAAGERVGSPQSADKPAAS